MKMTPVFLVVGSLMVFWASVCIMVFMAVWMIDDQPSAAWRPWTPAEQAGHRLYVQNGCSYCHSLFIRVNDWDVGAERLAEPGDYYGQNPAILGTQRTGPDLSQEGGEHSADWHLAHFTNPRHTRPLSLMPSWEFLGDRKIGDLTAYVEALGGRDADLRVARQKRWGAPAAAAYERGPDQNVAWLHAQVPEAWRGLPNPYPATAAGQARGQKIYQGSCINCHGPMGDGNGSAAQYLRPKPLNFTELRGRLIDGKYIGGLFYYQIMNGITGTAMPYFKRELESEKIWDVSNYLAVKFLGYTDANIEPRGIDASYEPDWVNPYTPPEQKPSPDLSLFELHFPAAAPAPTPTKETAPEHGATAPGHELQPPAHNNEPSTHDEKSPAHNMEPPAHDEESPANSARRGILPVPTARHMEGHEP